MSQDHEPHVRQEAELRVRQHFAQARGDMIKWHQTERRKDFREQKLALDRLTQREDALKEERRRALEQLDRAWQQQRDRLGTAPGPAPAFGFLPPARDIHAEYNRMRDQYVAQRDQCKERFGEQLQAMQRQRGDLLHRFQTANQVRDRIHTEAQVNLVDRQNKGFERVVQKEIDRQEGGPRREFERRAREMPSRARG